jgi:hypothetical protein
MRCPFGADTVKVRLQTHPAGVYRGGLDCVRQTVRAEGALSLYKGMGSPLSTAPLVNAVVFASFATAKDALQRFRTEPGQAPRPLELGDICLAGGVAGLVNSAVVGPVELIKTRLQIQHERAPSLRRRPFTASTATATAAGAGAVPFRGPIDCIRRIVRTEGVIGLFRGMNATVLREIPAYTAQFYAYESIKRLLTPVGQSPDEIGSGRLMLSGGCAGIACWLASYPQDHVKSVLQAVPLDKPSPYREHSFLGVRDGGFVDCWKTIVRQGGGHRALWRGFGPCVARAFPANAAGFLTYETTLKFMRDNDIK